jgi:nitrite reductase (NO-forming)/hydroxylamine reductase
VVFDGLTLKPLARGDIGGVTVDRGEPLVENRVGVVLASHTAPRWYLALKESGHVAVVDYSAPGFPLTRRIDALRFLHDGGWDASGRYLLIAANASDHMVVVDSQTEALVATIPTGVKPHPGRGANWIDPVHGPVASTLHMGEGRLAVYGTDPSLPAAWKVVRSVALPSAGSLFHKTHPASPWVLMDFPLAQEPAARSQICAYSKEKGTLESCWQVSGAGPAVHFEFNRAGSEVWVSTWAAEGELVVYDAVTLKELRRVKGLHTPTGKFNVFNTANDVY